MASAIEMSVSRQALSAIVRRIRNRWRLKIVLHGLAVVLGAAAVGAVVGPWLMARFNFNPAAIVAVRLLFFGALIALAYRHLLTPIRRRATNDQVALYLEEREPSLQALMVSAVEVTEQEAPAYVRSPSLAARLVDSAVAKVRTLGEGSQLENRSLTTSALVLLGVLAAGMFLLQTGPAQYANMLNPVKSPLEKPVYIAVAPGNADVTKGGDVAVGAQLHGFLASEATLAVQRTAGGEWEKLPMTVARDSGAFELRLFDVRTPTNYYVEANRGWGWSCITRRTRGGRWR
jgi:MFS family permease